MTRRNNSHVDHASNPDSGAQAPQGLPLYGTRLLGLNSREAVNKALSRLASEEEIERLARGVYVRPKMSRYVGTVMPDITKVVEAIARRHGETEQVHGAKAARRFKLSIQMPVAPVLHTSGPSRTRHISNIEVRLMHTTSARMLQFAGQKTALALSALWYLGKANTNAQTVGRITA